MFAHASILTNAYAGPEFGPLDRQALASADESDTPSASAAENLRLANNSLTVIDFEVSAALSLCGGWHADWKADIYLVRTLERIAEHLKALKEMQAVVSPPLDASSLFGPADPITANEHNVLVMKPR